MTPELIRARLWRAATKNEQHQLDAETLLAAVELIKAGRALSDAVKLQIAGEKKLGLGPRYLEKHIQAYDAALGEKE